MRTHRDRRTRVHTKGSAKRQTEAIAGLDYVRKHIRVEKEKRVVNHSCTQEDYPVSLTGWYGERDGMY